MRLRSDIWVSAYLRRADLEGAVAVLRHRGAAEAGAIFVKLDRLDGEATLFAPAPQALIDDDDGIRRFHRAHTSETLPVAEIEAMIARERRFDPDCWVVEVEERQGRHFLDLV